VGDKLFVFARQEGNEVTLCLDAATGKEIWRDQYESQGATGASGRAHPGPRSSPTVAEGKVVTLGVRGILSCLEADTGKLVWRKDDFQGSWPQFFTSSSPIVVDGLSIAQLGGDSNGAIVAYELATGNQQWKWTGDGTAYASPVLLTVHDTKVIVTLTEENIVGIGVADGKLLWETPFAGGGRSYNAATPIVEGQTIIYCGSGRGTKAVEIDKQGDQLAAKELWSNADESVQFNTPVLKNGLLFGLSNRGNLFCVNAQSGQTAWTSAIGGRGGFGSVVDAGSVMLALTPSAQLLVFEPTDKGFEQLASYKVTENETYAHPIAAGNGFYIKDQDSVALWTVD
jgi:outer membrane protein assembly factor BamB